MVRIPTSMLRKPRQLKANMETSPDRGVAALGPTKDGRAEPPSDCASNQIAATTTSAFASSPNAESNIRSHGRLDRGRIIVLLRFAHALRERGYLRVIDQERSMTSKVGTES